MRLTSATLLFSLFALGLTSCASMPTQDKLFSGIDTTKLAATSATTKLSGTDPTCVSFYENVNSYYQQAQKAKGGQQFVSSLGLNVVASLLTRGLIPSGISSTAGQIAASSAASSVTSQGTQIALRELNSTDGADAKIIAAANQIGCPVAIQP